VSDRGAASEVDVDVGESATDADPPSAGDAVPSPSYAVGRAGEVRARLAMAWPHLSRVIRTSRLQALVPWAGLAVTLALWAAGLAMAHGALVGSAGLGLVAVLPDVFWAAVAVLTLSFAWAVVRRPTQWPVLTAHTLALVAILRATPVIVYHTLRYSWAWKHVGVIDYISHHGVDFHLGGILGVYQGWPGFFALNSFLLQASGQSTALSYANWVLPINDLIWLGPVILIARAFTADQRMIWTGAWLFELGNWIGQDYFSPQAFTYFLYLTVIAVCLRWFRNREDQPWRMPAFRPTWLGRLGLDKLPLPTWLAHRQPPQSVSLGATSNSRSARSPATRWAMTVLLLPLMAAIASSHQLTPFMLIAALALLVFFRQIRGWVLPVAMAAITAGWIAYGGLPWLVQNGSQLLEGLGLPWANTSAHLVGESQVPPDQLLAEWAARLLSAGVAVLAGIGFLRYRKHHYQKTRRFWLSIPILAAAGLPSVAANSYGGEIIFRVFLFAVPFLAVAGGAAFFPHPRAGRAAWAGPALAVTLLAMVAGFSLGNYGSEEMNYFSPAEVAASSWLYRTAPAGAQVIAATSNFPWAYVHYNWYSYTFLDTPPALSRDVLRAPVSAMARLMGSGHAGDSYLILTRSQGAEISLTAEWPPGAFSRLTRVLEESSRFRVVYHNADAVILQLAPAGSGGPSANGVRLRSPAAAVASAGATAGQPPLAVPCPPAAIPGQVRALLGRCR
jgi:hypothetical protein